jgi:hypothetical protein
MGDDTSVPRGINSILFEDKHFVLLEEVARKISKSPQRRTAFKTILDLANESVLSQCRADSDIAPPLQSDYLMYTRSGVSITFTKLAPNVIEITFIDLYESYPNPDPSPRSPNGGARIAAVNLIPEPENPVRLTLIFMNRRDNEEKSNDILVPIIADDASCDVLNKLGVVLYISVGDAFSSGFTTSLGRLKEFIKSMEMSDKTALLDAYKEEGSNASFTIVPALARIAEIAPDALNVLRDGLEDPSFAIRFSVTEYVKSKSGLADKCLSVFWNEYARRRSVAFALKSGLIPVIIADDASCDVVNEVRFVGSLGGATGPINIERVFKCDYDEGRLKELIKSRSVEHNVDVCVALRRLAAGDSVVEIFDPFAGRFHAMAATLRYRNRVGWQRQFVQEFCGFNIIKEPITVPNGIAWEFTGQKELTVRELSMQNCTNLGSTCVGRKDVVDFEVTLTKNHPLKQND